MRKLLIGAALCSLVAAPALAGEPATVTTQPVTLSAAQMDKVTAGGGTAACVFAVCVQVAEVDQDATAIAVGGGIFADTNALAQNLSAIDQEIGNNRD